MRPSDMRYKANVLHALSLVKGGAYVKDQHPLVRRVAPILERKGLLARTPGDPATDGRDFHLFGRMSLTAEGRELLVGAMPIARVYIEDEPPVECIRTPDRWNGFAVPAFTQAQIEVALDGCVKAGFLKAWARDGSCYRAEWSQDGNGMELIAAPGPLGLFYWDAGWTWQYVEDTDTAGRHT